MGKLIQMDVLIVGLRGLGVEIAKNLILAGPRSVTLFDPKSVTHADLGCNYYFSSKHLGQNRAASCHDALAELNNYVKVSVLSAPALSEEIVSKYHCIVLTDSSREDAIRYNDFCRSKEIGFIAADVLGIAGYCFVDFGEKHVVRDPDGEQTKSAVVVGVSRGAKTIVYTHDNKRHGIDSGSLVKLRDVEGTVEINGDRAYRVLSVTPYSLTLDLDSTTFSEYVTGGNVEEFKEIKTVSFASLKDRLYNPLPSDDSMGMMLTPDLSKFDRPGQLHAIFSGIEEFRKRNGRLPTVRNKEEADDAIAFTKEFIAAAKAANGNIFTDEVPDDVVRSIATLASTELPALSAFFGGVVAQEVVKLTGKFSPIRQYLYLDAMDAIPKESLTDDTYSNGANAANFAGSNSRYDNLVSIFGKEFQAKVADQRVFVVGAGALGCEFLKNYAMMGLGSGRNGSITVTDMDRIETSNLNRQFLFRQWNVGHPKSVTAAAAARVMNSDLKVEALEVPVGEDTETTFNDAFWENLDFVTNALDNLKARQYVDGRCVFFCKPLLESGTLGTKANTQVVLPYKTETYSDSQDPPEESIPMCTLRNFPYQIEHCIEWARDIFAGAFTNPAQEACAFIKSPSEWLTQVQDDASIPARRVKLEGVKTALNDAKNATFEACVLAARKAFDSFFNISIRQLLHNFPVDYTDSNGLKFWSGAKRYPVAADFNRNDPLHLAFIVHATALYASNFGINLPAGYDTDSVIGPVLDGISLPPFAPKNVKLKADEKDTTVEGAEDDSLVVAALTAELEKIGESYATSSSSSSSSATAANNDNVKLYPADFEKDDDSNHHIDFITAASNLRARNYRIQEATRYQVKMTAGKIIPAIATTTCMVTGLVCLEAYKLIAGKTLEETRNSFVNLAMNVYAMGEPGGPKRTKSGFDPIACGEVKAIPEGFTRWEKIVIKDLGNATPVELVKWFKDNRNLEVSMISSGKSYLYNPLLFKSHREQRSNVPLSTILQNVSKTENKTDYIMLDVSANDDDGDVLIPPVQLYLK